MNLNKVFCIFLLSFQLLSAQEEFGYNLLPEKTVTAFKSATEPQQIYLSRYWSGIPKHVPDLVSKTGFYPKEIDRYYYFDHYIGLRLYDPNKSNNQTYATIKLKHPLEKGKKYKLYVGGFFPYGNGFVENFIREKANLRTEFQFQQNIQFVRNQTDNFTKIPFGYSFNKIRPNSIKEAAKNAVSEIISTQGYFKFYTEITATEDAEYLTLGNFLKNSELPKEILFEIQKYILIFEVNLTESEYDNLIPNGDFEGFSEQPTNFGQWWRLDHWFNPNPNREFNEHLPSPDLITKQPRFKNSPSIRNEGSSRVGYINMDTLVFNEGLAVKLKNKMSKGKRYALSFNVGSTNQTTNKFISRKRTGTDLDSLKVQFGFSHARPEQGDGKFLSADQKFYYSQFLSYLFTNKVVIMTFTAEDDYEYFTFGYFEELDLPSFGSVGVKMDDIYLYEIPEETLAPEINTGLVSTALPESLNPIKNENIASIDKLPIPSENVQNNTDEKKEEQQPIQIQTETFAIIDIPEKTPQLEKLKRSNFYDEKDSTQVKVKYDLNVQKPSCKLTVYDHGTEDGDIVTLKLDDQEIVKHLKIRRKPNVATFEIELKKGENYLYPIAENLGRIPPNTIQVIVKCEDQEEEKSYRLFSEPGNSDALRLNFEN